MAGVGRKVCIHAVVQAEESGQLRFLGSITPGHRDRRAWVKGNFAAPTSYLFIAHNIGVVEYIADHIAVMNRRRSEQSGPARSVLSNRASGYTRTLLVAVPRIAVSA